MPISLAEFRRSVQHLDPTYAGVVAIYEENAPILGEGRGLGYALPSLKFDNTPGRVASFTREKALPTVGFRAPNTQFTASVGETETITETKRLGGGRVVFDRALVASEGEAAVRDQQIMTIKAFARAWSRNFYKGDGTNETFNGLQNRISGKQLIDLGGKPLNLKALNTALLSLSGDKRVLIMGKEMASILQTAALMSNNVRYVAESFGQAPATFGGVPIMLAGQDTAGNEILDFSETGDTTSIYLLSLGDSGVVGVQTQPIQVYYLDAGNKIDSTFDVEWDSSFIIRNPASAIRISGIANEDIVTATTFPGFGPGTAPATVQSAPVNPPATPQVEGAQGEGGDGV